MLEKYSPDVLTYDELEVHSKYGNNPSKEARMLDDMRLHAIPETIELRKKAGDVFLEKTELIVLVEWRAFVLFHYAH